MAQPTHKPLILSIIPPSEARWWDPNGVLSQATTIPSMDCNQNILMKSTEQNSDSQQIPLTFTYTPHNIVQYPHQNNINQLVTGRPLRGKPAALALKDLTAEEKEAHRAQNQRERNKRYHDKAKIYNTLEALPSNKDRILLVLHLFNPGVSNIDQSKLETDLTNLLNSIGLP